MEIFAQCPAYAVHRIFEGLGENPLFETRVAVEGVPVVGVQKTTIHTFTVEGEEKNEGILLANSKSLSFSALIFGKAQERLD